MDGKCFLGKLSQNPKNLVAQLQASARNRKPNSCPHYRRRKHEHTIPADVQERRAKTSAASRQPLSPRRPKNKCGPGQPPGPHCLAEYPVAQFHARGMGEFISHARSEERSQWMRLGRPPFAERTPQTDLQHYGGQRPVLPCVEDSVRRPQRPGNQSAPKRFSGRTPWQFTLENYQEPPTLPQCSGRTYRTSRFDVSTLRFARPRFKQKSAARCAETVDARNSLWKALEKSDRTPGIGREVSIERPCRSWWQKIKTLAPARSSGQPPLRMGEHSLDHAQQTSSCIKPPLPDSAAQS